MAVAVGWRDDAELVTIGLERTAGHDLDVTLAINGDPPICYPAVEAGPFDLQGSGGRSNTAEMFYYLIRSHVYIVGIPTKESIGIPTLLLGSIVGMATTVGGRLRKAREELQRREEPDKRPNRSQFAREIGIRPASLTEIESGESKAPSSETLLKIRDRGINPDYVMKNKGPMLIDHVERHMNKQTILGLMDEMDEHEQQTVIDVAAAIVRKKPGPGSAADPFKKKPPKTDN